MLCVGRPGQGAVAAMANDDDPTLDPFLFELLLQDVKLVPLQDAARAMEGVEFLHPETPNRRRRRGDRSTLCCLCQEKRPHLLPLGSRLQCLFELLFEVPGR